MNPTDEHLLVDASQQTKFERGFKTWCENTSRSVRERLGLTKYDPLSPFKLAEYMKVRVITPRDVIGLPAETIEYLTSSQGDEWSAVTIRANGIDVIVLNPFHSERRQANTLMHELSHILRRHESSQVVINDIGITFRNFNKLQEAEADWLAGTLLLPNDVLIHCCYKNYTEEQACETFGMSSALYKYRMNVTGIKKRFNGRHH